MRVKIDDFPPAVKAQILAKLAAQDRATRPQPPPAPQPVATQTMPTPKPAASKQRSITPKGPNKTEAAYNRAHLGGNGRFEALTLRLPGGSRYTPDWMTLDGPQVTLHEVKGSYRLGSQGRAYTAFREAAAAFPCFRFVWAERDKGGNGYAVREYQPC